MDAALDKDASSTRWVVAVPAGTVDTHAVRGTLLIASRTQLRAHGHFDAYVAELPEEAREQLEQIVPGSWLPLTLAHAHFTAADALGLSESEVLGCTQPSAERLHQVFLTTAFRLVRSMGLLTPWTGLPAATKIWKRLFEGGALGIERLGPKEANIIVASHPLLRHRYHRVGLRAHTQHALNLCSQRGFVREVACDLDKGTMTLLARWV